MKEEDVANTNAPWIVTKGKLMQEESKLWKGNPVMPKQVSPGKNRKRSKYQIMEDIPVIPNGKYR